MTPWVTRLIIANVVVFVVTSYFVPGSAELLALVPAQVAAHPWTPITYMFVHAGWAHIFFNMLALYFFGPRLEARLGGGRFLILYFASGLGGAALSVITPDVAIVGASGAIMGVLVGYARYWPRDRIYIWAILPIEARWLLIGLIGWSILGGLGVLEPGVAHFAHLGGIVVGYLYLRWAEAHSPAARFKKRATETPRATPANVERWRTIRPDDMHPVNRDEYERIRAKLDEVGAAGLTGAEREFLDRFSRN